MNTCMVYLQCGLSCERLIAKTEETPYHTPDICTVSHRGEFCYVEEGTQPVKIVYHTQNTRKVSLPNDFVRVLLTPVCLGNSFHIHCTCTCCYEYSYAVSIYFEQKNISYIQYMNTSCQCVFQCVFLVQIQLQTLFHNLFAHVVLSCCHMQVQLCMLRSLFLVTLRLQKCTKTE